LNTQEIIFLWLVLLFHETFMKRKYVSSRRYTP